MGLFLFLLFVCLFVCLFVVIKNEQISSQEIITANRPFEGYRMHKIMKAVCDNYERPPLPEVTPTTSFESNSKTNSLQIPT